MEKTIKELKEQAENDISLILKELSEKIDLTINEVVVRKVELSTVIPTALGCTDIPNGKYDFITRITLC